MLGIRRWYAVMSRLTGDKMMRLDGPPDRTRDDLVELWRMSRYYAWANFWRGALYVPPAWMLFQVQAWFGFGLLAFLIVFHALCWQLEFYRTAMAHELDRRELYLDSTPPKVLTDTEIHPHWFYNPKKWESEKFYERFGFAQIRDWVVTYTNKTKLKRSERQSGEKAQFVGGKAHQLVQFERDTRTGEKLHLTAASLNLPPLFEFLLHGMGPWAGYLGLILILDISLALLQRYHRVRVVRLWSRSRRTR